MNAKTRRYALAFTIAFMATGACAGEVIDCAEAPGRGKWVYRRDVGDTGKACWFPANGLRRGREKPREELRWPQAEIGAPPPMIVIDPDPAKMRAPWEVEHRWKGE